MRNIQTEDAGAFSSASRTELSGFMTADRYLLALGASGLKPRRFKVSVLLEDCVCVCVGVRL